MCDVNSDVKSAEKLVEEIHASPWGFPGRDNGKEFACQSRRYKRCKFNPWVGKIPGEENGNPYQYSCLANLMDRRAWWDTVRRVAESTEQLSMHTHITLHTSVPLCGHDPSVLGAAKASKSSPANLLLPAVQLLIRKRWETGGKIIPTCKFRPAPQCSVPHRDLLLETSVLAGDLSSAGVAHDSTNHSAKHRGIQFNQCDWVRFQQTPVQRLAEMLNERENESLVGKHNGHNRAVSHAQKLESTPALWQLVGCRPRAFPTVPIHSRVPKSLFCCQVRKHLLSLSFMFNRVGRGADYPGGEIEMEEMPACALSSLPLSLKGGHLSSGLFEAIRRLLL